MGPPISRITASGGGWTVTEASDARFGAYIQGVQGTGPPAARVRRRLVSRHRLDGTG